MQSYVVRSKVDKSGKEEKVRYYGTPVTSGQVTEADLAVEVTERCSLTTPDVLAAVSVLGSLIGEHLKMGETIKLTGIGTFSISASSDGFDTPEECTPATVKAKRVCFKADKGLRKVLGEMKYKKSNRAKTK